MTTSEQQAIIAALHAMEVRFTERLTTIEAEAKAWRSTHDELRIDIMRVEDNAKEAARVVAATQAQDKDRIAVEMRRVEDECTKGQQRLTIGLIIVGFAAAGRLAVILFQFFT